jgi:hypothetical protein
MIATGNISGVENAKKTFSFGANSGHPARTNFRAGRPDLLTTRKKVLVQFTDTDQRI